MGLIETKTFQNGEHVAIDLPAEFGFGPGERFTIERIGQGFEFHPVEDPEEEMRSNARMIEALRALGPVGEIGERDSIEFPDRHGPEIGPVADAEDGKRQVAEMIAARRAVPAVGEIEPREPYDFPDRVDD